MVDSSTQENTRQFISGAVAVQLTDLVYIVSESFFDVRFAQLAWISFLNTSLAGSQGTCPAFQTSAQRLTWIVFSLYGVRGSTKCVVVAGFDLCRSTTQTATANSQLASIFENTGTSSTPSSILLGKIKHDRNERRR